MLSGLDVFPWNQSSYVYFQRKQSSKVCFWISTVLVMIQWISFLQKKISTSSICCPALYNWSPGSMSGCRILLDSKIHRLSGSNSSLLDLKVHSQRLQQIIICIEMRISISLAKFGKVFGLACGCTLDQLCTNLDRTLDSRPAKSRHQ